MTSFMLKSISIKKFKQLVKVDEELDRVNVLVGTNNSGKSSFPVPPLAAQRWIVAELDALKRLQAGTAAELDALLPAILDRAFKGEL